MADHELLNQTNDANTHQTGETDDAKGQLAGDRGDAKAEPSGYRGDNPSSAGTGQTHVSSATPDNALQQLNPSAPGDTGTTPGTNAKIG